MNIMFSGYDYSGLTKGLEDLGHKVWGGEYRNWYAWAHGTDKVKAGTAHSYMREMIKDFKKYNIHMFILSKGFDSNVAQPKAKPPYWYVSPHDLHIIQDAGIVVMTLDLDSPDSFGFLTNCGIAEASSVIGTCCIETKRFFKTHTKAEVFEFWPAHDDVVRGTIYPHETPCDFLMIGSPYVAPNHQFGIPRRNIVQAALEVTKNVQIWGPKEWLDKRPDYGGDADLKPYYQGLCPWEQVHNVCAAAKITYNSFLRTAFRYVNDRIFIAGGAGSFLLMESQIGLDTVFKHVGWHKKGDIKDFQHKLEYYLNHEEERAEKAKKNMDFIRSEHSYSNRAKVISEIGTKTFTKIQHRRKRCCRQRDLI